MFSAVEHISRKWAEEQQQTLCDVQQLVATIEPICGTEILKLIYELRELNEDCRLQICRDHVFQNSLDEVRLTTIAACEGQSKLDCDCIYRFTTLTQLAIALLAKEGSAVPLHPLAGARVLVPAVGARIDIPIPESVNSNWQAVVSRGRVFVGTSELSQAFYARSGCIKIVDRDLDFFWDRSNTMHGIALADTIEVEQWLETLESARKLVATSSSSQSLVQRYVSYLVPLQQGTDDINFSFSARNFPAVVFKNHESAAHMVGETLVHEADHQFFYVTERFEQFFRIEPSCMKAVHFSPWRDDPRPLDGILRGLSAFARVSEYYASALESDTIDNQQREAIETLLVTRLVEAEQALVTVLGSGELSDFGQAYAQEINKILQQVKRSAVTLAAYEPYRIKAESAVNMRRHKFLEEFRGDKDFERR